MKLKNQKQDKELKATIRRFAKAMELADKEYIATRYLDYSDPTIFTPNMKSIWYDYVNLCKRNVNEKAQNA